MRELFDKFLANQCTEQETEKLLKFLTDEASEDERNHLLKHWIEEMQYVENGDIDKELLPKRYETIKELINKTENNVKYGGGYRFIRILKVAAVFLIIIISTYLYTYLIKSNKQNDSVQKTAKHAEDLNPGYNKAILTLSNGKQIILDSTNKTSVLKVGNMTLKESKGVLSYAASKENKNEGLNSLTIPKCGQYKLILSDGTKVWLNASSSIQYPSVFSGNSREVTITGEAYFEVAKNLSKPFIAHINNTKVEVLGTHFNINGYADDSNIHTTLLEGSIKIKYFNNELLIKPGQQATCTHTNEMKVSVCDDMDNIIAWKNGLFAFKDLDIKIVMQQLSRWYDFEPVFNTNVNKHFWCLVSRDVPLSQVLNMLQATGEVKFRIENRKVYVMDN